MSRIALRQVAFFEPTDAKGKWHAAYLVTHTPACGATATLGQENVIRSQVGGEVHKIVCGRCVRFATWPGYSAEGLER